MSSLLVGDIPSGCFLVPPLSLSTLTFTQPSSSLSPQPLSCCCPNGRRGPRPAAVYRKGRWAGWPVAQTLAPPQLMYRWRPYGRHLYYHICPRNVLSYCYMCISTINTVLIDSGIQVPSFLPSGVLMEFRWKPCGSWPGTVEWPRVTRLPGGLTSRMIISECFDQSQRGCLHFV